MINSESPVLLVFGEDFDFNEQVSVDFGYEGFRVLVANSAAGARHFLFHDTVDVVITPFGWTRELDPLTAQALAELKPLIITAEGVMRSSRPALMVPMIKRSLHRRIETEAALGKILHYLQGKRAKAPLQRHQIDLPVSLRWSRESSTLQTLTKTFNVSAKGFFAALAPEDATLPRIGEKVFFSMAVKDSRMPPISAFAQVTWTRAHSPARVFAPVGFGAQILRAD